MKPSLDILESVHKVTHEINEILKILAKDSCGNYVDERTVALFKTVDKELTKAHDMLQSSMECEQKSQDDFEKRVMGREYGMSAKDTKNMEGLSEDIQERFTADQVQKDTKQKKSDKDQINAFHREAKGLYWVYDKENKLLGWFPALTKEEAVEKAKRYPDYHRVTK